MMSSNSHPHADVRMKGFAQRATVEQATAWIDSVLPAQTELPREELNLWRVSGRTLAEPVISPLDVPQFARSMMDGFAMRAEETHGATSYNPLPFRVLGTCLPGQPFAKPVGPGEAVRIMTGAPLPLGADAVLPVEQTEIQGELVLAARPAFAGQACRADRRRHSRAARRSSRRDGV